MKKYFYLIFWLLILLPIVSAQTCMDSDGGFEPKIKGTISGYVNITNYTYTDECINGSLLKEYYCVNLTWRFGIYDCNYEGPNYICSGGRCVYAPRGGGGGGRALLLGLSSFYVQVIILVVALVIVFYLILKKSALR